jgi:hypothetical protein
MQIEIDEAHTKLDEIHEKIMSDNFKGALSSIRKFQDVLFNMENSVKLRMKNQKYGSAEDELYG